jgi:hypothetical protein
MQRRGKVRRWLLIGSSIAVVGVALCAFAWTNRTSITAWYAIRGLTNSAPAERGDWMAMIQALDPPPIGQLVSGWRSSDAGICENLRHGLTYLVQSWTSDNPYRVALAIELTAQFPTLSLPGQEAALEVYMQLLHAGSNLSASHELMQATAEILSAAAGAENGAIHTHALALLEHIDENIGPSPELLSSSRRLVSVCLSDKQTDCRTRALQLARRPEMDLVNEVVGLLNDPEPELRRSAMLMVGPIETAITTDSLLHWLHDPDLEVRRLCEKALRARGLQDAHLLLGRTMTDSKPGTRLQVIELLKRADDLEPGAWLRRLSHDPSAAVRAAAIRAAAEQSLAQLADRLEQMSQNDPCATVRQLAQFYLSTYH